MNNNKQQLNINIDIKNTQPVVSEDGNQVFAEGVILRKVSRFVTGTQEDGIIPVPCFYDVKTGKVLVDLLPKELKEMFQDDNI
jgi:hypothetical protein